MRIPLVAVGGGARVRKPRRERPAGLPLPLGAWPGGPDDDLFTLDDDDPGAAPAAAAVPLVVLVVDDDRDVHESTLLALRDEKVAGRPLVFLHAYSGAEALVMMAERPGIDVMLLDVVMETPDAGLRVADAVRADPRMAEVKIIIRTGQPGLAPAETVARDHGVHGYLTKEKLTRTLLLQAIAGTLDDTPPGGGIQ